VAIAHFRWQIILAAFAAVMVVALPTAFEGMAYVSDHQLRGSEVAVAKYIRDHARPGDTDYVMYARPNVVYYAGLRHPYPYMWSLMVRAKPGALPQLQRLLGSSQRPTWLVQWHSASDWDLDPDGRTAGLIGRGYRLAATVCGRGIYLRSDRARPPLQLGICPGRPKAAAETG
jgi:hypothetical protein